MPVVIIVLLLAAIFLAFCWKLSMAEVLFGLWGLLHLLTAFLARRKGYSFLIWLLALPAVALLVQAFLPNAKNTNMPEEQRCRLKKRGDLIGFPLALINVILLIALFSSVLRLL